MIEPSLLQVRGLSKTYQNRTGLFRRRAVEAIKPLSFDLDVGQTLAIVGEAGSGKSTLARILAGMMSPPAATSPSRVRPWCMATTRPAASCCA